MYRSSAKRLSAFIVSVAAGLYLASTALIGAETGEKKAASGVTIRTMTPTKVGVSKPLRDHLIRPVPHTGPIKVRPEVPPHTVKAPPSVPRPADPSVQRTVGQVNIPDPIENFEGQFQTCGCLPPDTNGAVGPNAFFQTVNDTSQIWDKSGNDLSGGAFATNSLWVDFGGICETHNDGDPVVVYDQLADRFIVTQFALDFGTPDFQECFAVSTTGDPLGTYNLYSYDSGTIWPDYPKVSVWPDAYHMTARQFNSSGTAFFGMVAVALDRVAMLAGAPALAIVADVGTVAPDLDGLLPSNLQGTTVPPSVGPTGVSTAANTLIGVGHPDLDGSPDSRLHLFYFHPDFVTPPGTFTGPVDISVDPFTPLAGGIPQPNGAPALDVFPWVMYPLNYRNFGDHESIVLNHNVDAGGGQSGVRWYELRNPRGLAPTAPPTIYQQGTYAPADGENRWMSAIAMDSNNNIAVGYSLASTSTFTSIRYAGRLAGDPLGNLSQGEAEIIAGTGTQDFFVPRWGDYSSLYVDPIDDCTFWYTTEYIAVSGPANWQTRVGSFKFASCLAPGNGILEGTVTDGTNPIAGATVTANAFSTSTDLAGHYSFGIPPGTYDMTASKYGFLPATADDVPVTDGGDTIQNFTLLPAPSTLVNGIVTDGSGGGWPLYAKIVVTGPGGFPGATLFSDPVTGYYAISLVQGNTYNFDVRAVSPGYLPGGGPVTVPAVVAPGGIVANWILFVDAGLCIAPGYTPGTPTPVLNESFDGGVLPPGWSVINNSGNGAGWVIQTDFAPCFEVSGNPTGGTGAFALINSDCDGFVDDDAELRTPSFDLSAFQGATVQFNQDYFNLGDVADVDMSTDGGANWTNVLRQTSSARGPNVQQTSLPGAGGQSDVRLRFHYYDAFFAWWWAVDNILVQGVNCNAGAGGLVVGNVRDANTGLGLNGATVANLPQPGSPTTTTFATPLDPNQDDGLYIIFGENGPQSYEASLTGYAPQTKATTVIPNSTVRLDFSLGAGILDASPRPMNSKVDPGEIDLQTLTMSNTGSVAATFHIHELNVPATGPVHLGPFADPEKIKQALARIPKGFTKQALQGGKLSLAGLPPLADAPKNTRPLAAGDVIATYPASFASPNGLPYGVMFNPAGDFWVSNLDSGFPGDNKDYRFLGNGTETGETIDMSSLGFLPVDGTFNVQTGMFWQATNDFFGGSNTCVYEIDPATKALTGNTICPAFPTPQTGLAYNVLTDTYYSGSFFDGVINHFDSNGVILDSASVGLNISGLAFNHTTGHLFVFNQDYGSGPTDDVYVLDVNNSYSVVGSFVVGPPGIGAAAGGGAEMDCNGNLLLVDQLGGNPILLVESGEGTECAFVDTIPWVSEDPTDGTVPAGGTFPVAVTFDSTGLLPGLRQAQLTFTTDTPYPVAPVPLNFTVRFLDVPDGFINQVVENDIYGVAGAGVMQGCDTFGDFYHFCPNDPVTRGFMARYIWRSVHGSFTPPPVYLGIFIDVFFTNPNADYIQGVYNDGITAGCQGPGQPLAYCPDQAIPREQMAVFVEKGLRGSSFVPPSCTPPGYFIDVPCPGTFTDWVELLFNDGITAGCNGPSDPPAFCPAQLIPNWQMAVFLVNAFHFPTLP